MMPQAQIRRIAVQAAAYELRVHAERDYVDEPTAQDVADRANELLRETYLYKSWLTMITSMFKIFLKFWTLTRVNFFKKKIDSFYKGCIILLSVRQ